MAQFEPCFEKVIKREGGYKLIDIPGDRGGQTYAGISRIKNKAWDGWDKVDRREFDDALKGMVKDFYKNEFWNKIYGDVIGFQSAAYNIFEFAVNAGLQTSIRLCQRIIKVSVDGIFGDNTLKALNSFIADEKDEKIFILSFSLMKVIRYKSIVMNDPRRTDDLLVSNQKFLCGWINRVESGLEYWDLRYP